MFFWREKMKKITTVMVIITILASVMSCSMSTIQETGETYGALTVDMSGNRGWIVNEYTVTATRSGYDPVTVVTTQSTVEIQLVVGNWDIEVIGKDDIGTVIYQGTSIALIEESGTTVTTGLLKKAGNVKVSISPMAGYGPGVSDIGSITRYVVTASKTGFDDVTEITSYDGDPVVLKGLVAGDWDITVSAQALNVNPQTYEIIPGHITYIEDAITTSVLSGMQVTENHTMTSQSRVTPVILSADSGTYTSLSLTLSCQTSGAQIYYSLDGSDPVTLYSGPVDLPSGTSNVKVKAVKSGMDDSISAERTYTIGSTAGITVYLYKPAGWSTAYIHYWDSAPDANTTWPGIEMSDEGNGWFSYTYPSATSTNIVFNDNAGNQTTNLVRSGSDGWYKDGNWYDVIPD
jgi:hypothetical protein